MARFDIQNQFSNLILRGNYYILDDLSLGLGYRGAKSVLGNINSPIFLLNLNFARGFNLNFCYEPSVGGANLILAGNSIEVGIIYKTSKSYCISNGILSSKGGKSTKLKRIPCPLFKDSKSLPPF